MAKKQLPAECPCSLDVSDIDGMTHEQATEVVRAEVARHQGLASEHAAIKVRTLDSALRMGAALNRAKDTIKHGEWADWLGKNWPQSDRRAQEYMQLARNFKQEEANQIRAGADLAATGSIKQALRLLGPEAKKRKKDEPIDAVYTVAPPAQAAPPSPPQPNIPEQPRPSGPATGVLPSAGSGGSLAGAGAAPPGPAQPVSAPGSVRTLSDEAARLKANLQANSVGSSATPLQLRLLESLRASKQTNEDIMGEHGLKLSAGLTSQVSAEALGLGPRAGSIQHTCERIDGALSSARQFYYQAEKVLTAAVRAAEREFRA